MDYFIHVEGQTPEGPLDLVAIIRRIRNGSITEETLIAVGGQGNPRQIVSYTEFSTFFAEDRALLAGAAGVVVRRRTLLGQLKVGFEFLNENWWVSIYSGAFMFLWVMIWAVFGKPESLFGITLAIFLSYFLTGPYLYGLMRLMRGHPLAFGSVLSHTLRGSVGLVVASLIVAMLMLPLAALITKVLSGTGLVLGVPLFFIVLLTLWTAFAYVPLLVLEKKRDFYDAVRESLAATFGRGAEKLGIVFALVAINFILFPLLLLILPISMAGLLDMYEEDCF